MIFFYLFICIFNTSTPINESVTLRTGKTPVKGNGVWVEYNVNF